MDRSLNLPQKHAILQFSNQVKPAASPISFESALSACTANGLWQPPSFDGDGLIDGSREAYDHQFYTPHFGMLYTPPQMSDHIGVTALIPRATPSPPLALCTAKSTRKAQPHLAQATILQSFAPRKRLTSLTGEAPNEAKTDAPTAASRQPLCSQCHRRDCKCKKRKVKTKPLNSILTFIRRDKPA